MKKVLFFICILTLCFTLVSCGGKTEDAKINLAKSEVYSDEDIQSAANLVIEEFEKSFDGCELIELSYEEYPDDTSKPDSNYIILFSNFKTGSSTKNGVEPNSDDLFSWHLTRSNENSNWKIEGYGHG